MFWFAREPLTKPEKDFLKEIGTELNSNLIFQNNKLSNDSLTQHKIEVIYLPAYMCTPKEELRKMATMSRYDKKGISISPYDMADTIECIKFKKELLDKIDSLDMDTNGARFNYKGKVVTIGFKNGDRLMSEIYAKYGHKYTPKKISWKNL